MRMEGFRHKFEREKSSKATRFDLISKGPEFFDELKDKIDSATTSVRLQTFLLSKDPIVGGPILESLEKAARRGVRVQVLADGMAPPIFRPLFIKGEKEAIEQLQKLEAEGLPISFRRPVEKGVHQSPFKRDHTKNIIIDAEDPEKAVGYIGGRNIWTKDLPQRDFMVRTQGELVGFLKTDFDRTWEGIDIYQRTYKDSDGNLLVSDVRRTDEIPYMIMDRMKKAKSRVWIETPYFDRLHLSNFLISLKRERPDLDIRFLTPEPEINNQITYKIFSPLYIEDLAEHGIPVFTYQPVFSHAKAALIDDEAVIGSSNFSRLHMLGGRNAEIELFTKDSDFVAQIEDWFASGFSKSEKWIAHKPTAKDKIYRTFRRKDHKYK